MSGHTTIAPDEFETAFSAADDGRFVYQLNRGLLGLYGVLLGAFWVYFLVVVLRDGFDIPLIVLAVVLGGATGFVFVNLMFWRRFVRVSGVVNTDDRILWRQGDKLFACRWEDVDFDALGLTDASLGDRKYEHWLTVGGARLYLFRPHVRMRNMEAFLGALLIHLKAAGAIPESGASRRPHPPTRGGKKKKKRKLKK